RGMQERHQPARGAVSRTGVEELQAELGEVVEAGLNVFDAIGDVMEATPPPGQESRDLRLRAGAAEQLDARLAKLEHDRLDAIGSHHLAMRGRRPGQALVGRDSDVEV